MERHHCLNFFPIATKSTIQPKKWRTHSLIFWSEITSQPFNQQYGGHTWEILPLSFSKIQSQPVNHRKRIHFLRTSDSSNFKLGLPRQNSKSTSQPGKAHTPYSKAMDMPVSGKTPLFEIFLLYPSQPFNQQYGGHTWEIFPLSFSKIQSQPVNQEKRTHHILRH